MPTDKPEYDVAISFLAKDEAIAAAIHRKLSETLNVFFFPRNQSELAGTDGMVSMRKPFLDKPHVTVVLYREQWGKTPWTQIEETAIKEACLASGWKRLFFIALDRSSSFPDWLPEYHVRYNWESFGLDEAVGAIKARALENGAQQEFLTPLKRAETLRADELYRRDKSNMNSQEGIAAILDKVSELFEEIEKHCKEVNAQGHLQIRHSKDLKKGTTNQSCILTDNRVGMIVTWRQQYSNLLDHSGLFVQEYIGGLILHHETSSLMYFDQPQLLHETNYDPELSLGREYGWKQEKSTEFISSIALAQKCVIQFMDLVDRYANGKIRNRNSL
jgi:hypothetical protein